MADERLRLVAEVTDQFTGPLGKMQTALKRTADAGSQHATALRKDFDGFNGVLGKAHTALGGMTPALSALGVAGFGAGAALGGVATAIRGFSASTQQLDLLSKATGVSIDRLRALGALGERFGVSTESMNGSVRNLAKNMYDLRQRYGEAYIDLQKMNLGGLAEQLVSAPNMDEAIKRSFEGLAKISDPEKRRRASLVIFGTEEPAALAGEVGNQIGTELEKTAQRLGRTTQQQVRASKDFERALSELRQNVEGLTHEALAPALIKLDEFVKTLQSPEALSIFNNLIKDIGNTLRTTKEEFEAIIAAWGKLKDFLGRGDQSQNRVFVPGLNGGALAGQTPALPQAGLEGRRSSIQQQLELLDRNPSAPDFQRKRDRMTEELKRVGDELEKLRTQGGATAQKSGFDAPLGGMGGLIQKASLGGGTLGGGAPSGMGGVLGGARGALSRGSSGGGGGSQDHDTPTPLGSGKGNARAARTGQMMAYAMDQLRREGVPEKQLRTAAAHLVGQATMESGLDPNKVHDGGTGYGIYGARDPKGWGNYPGARRSAMVRWLEAHGYARSSAEGQMRYMSHEAMTDRSYATTRRVLMGQGTGDLETDTNTITKNFEAPRVINRRSGAVGSALRTGPEETASAASGKAADVPGAGSRAGDQMMQRFYGDGASSGRGPMSIDGRASLHIEFKNPPPGMRTKSQAEGLFKDVTVAKQRQVATESI